MHSSNVANKRRLPKGVVYKMGCRGGTAVAFCTLTWTIPRPSSLKNGVLYGKEKGGAVVTVLRNRNSFTFWFTSKHYAHTVSCCVFLDETRRSAYLDASESSRGTFQVHFDSLLRDTSNVLLKEGILVVRFMFGWRHKRMIRVCPTTGLWNPLIPDDGFIDFTEKLSKNRYTSDFAFRIKDQTLNANKALIVARSPYFAKISSASEMTVRNTTLDALVTVLIYLYGGAMTMECTDEVIPVLELAVQWNLYSLVELCRLWLEEKLNESNVNRIRDVAVKHGIQGLIKYTSFFLDRDHRHLLPGKR